MADEITFDIGRTKDGVIIIRFNQPILQLGLSKDQARFMGNALLEQANAGEG